MLQLAFKEGKVFLHFVVFSLPASVEFHRACWFGSTVCVDYYSALLSTGLIPKVLVDCVIEFVDSFGCKRRDSTLIVYLPWIRERDVLIDSGFNSRAVSQHVNIV